jgi:N-acetylglucosamine-6-sulfatase
MQGKSWRPLVTGKGQSAPWRRAFLYEMFGGGADPAHPTVKALRTERYKLILNLNPRELDELYDLQNDPQEMRNLARQKGHEDLIKDLKRQMLELMREFEDPAIPAVQATL